MDGNHVISGAPSHTITPLVKVDRGLKQPYTFKIPKVSAPLGI